MDFLTTVLLLFQVKEIMPMAITVTIVFALIFRNVIDVVKIMIKVILTYAVVMAFLGTL